METCGRLPVSVLWVLVLLVQVRLFQVLLCIFPLEPQKETLKRFVFSCPAVRNLKTFLTIIISNYNIYISDYNFQISTNYSSSK